MRVYVFVSVGGGQLCHFIRFLLQSTFSKTEVSSQQDKTYSNSFSAEGKG